MWFKANKWREGIDDKLYEFRKKAITGKLSPGDYQQLNRELVEMREKAKQGELRDEKGGKLSKFKSYAKVKSFAMSIAQILFGSSKKFVGKNKFYNIPY